MQNPFPGRFLLPVGLAAVLWLAAPAPVTAAPLPTPQPDPAPEAQERGAETEESDPAKAVDGMSRKDRRQTAKQKRIDEYLRKKEARLAKKDQKKLESALAEAEAAEAPKTDSRADGSMKRAPDAKMAMTPGEKETDQERQKRLSKLPKRLIQVQDTVRESRIGSDPTVVAYLDKIERQEASAQQLAAFGSFLSQNGMVLEAQEYYQIATNVDRKDPVLWLNLGILQRQTLDSQRAASSFARALSINPNNAAAHYNLGATLDEMGKYNEALEEYKIALRLDPTLGDPSVNPQAANNDRLMAVKLMLYKEQSGATTLPLADVPGGGLDEQPVERRR